MSLHSIEYWDNYYKPNINAVIPPPSQFAVFVTTNIEQNSLILDLGCGNGRDSIFFASQGHQVFGIDGSYSAIECCNQIGRARGLNIDFKKRTIEELCVDDIINIINSKNEIKKLVVYSRFFIHAITDEQEDELLKWLLDLATRLPIEIFFEYRTLRDQSLPKVTKEHYRRYINPIYNAKKYLDSGFNIEYFVEGFGFAKYRNDDAHVARVVFRSY